MIRKISDFWYINDNKIVRNISDVYSFNYINNDNENKIINKKNKLLEFIDLYLKKINNNIYIISCKYDIIYYRYNNILLTILILSTIITLIQSFQLLLLYYNNINNNKLILITNLICLCLITILTILSSIIKFKNYFIIMGKLKDIQHILFIYKLSYNKQKELLIFFDINGNLSEEIFKKLYNKIIDYNNEIKDINIYENIRNNEIIKFNKNKNKNKNKNGKYNLFQ